MIDRKKVILGLETCSHADEVGCDQCPYYGTQGERGCQSTMQMDALTLLREQEPVKPKLDDAWPSPIKVCGVCGTCLFCVGDYKPKYCSECGRAVKWE